MIKVNFAKAKEIAHAKRRFARSKEMAPWDLKATIPFEAELAEEARAKIREKYKSIQDQIDLSQTTDQLKPIVDMLAETIISQ